MDIVRSLAETRGFVHYPCHKNLRKTSLFLQIAPGADKSLGYVVFSMLRISHLRNANRAAKTTSRCPLCSKGSKVVNTTLPVLCWSCISAALKSVTIWSNSTQCHLLWHEYPDEDDVDGGNCVLRNGAMFLPLHLNSKQAPRNFPVYTTLKAAFPNLTIDDFRTNALVLRDLQKQASDASNVINEAKRKARATKTQRALVGKRAKTYSEPLGAEEVSCLDTMRQTIAALEGLPAGENSVHLVN